MIGSWRVGEEKEMEEGIEDVFLKNSDIVSLVELVLELGILLMETLMERIGGKLY